MPGEFALLMTEERVSIPRHLVGFISLKFTYSLKGLINISGRHVDPAFEGHVVYSVYNAGPNAVVMRRGDRAFMIVFATLSGEVPEEEGGAGRPGAKFLRIDKLESEWISSVKGPSVSLTALNARVAKLSQRVDILLGLLLAILGSLVVAIVIGVSP